MRQCAFVLIFCFLIPAFAAQPEDLRVLTMWPKGQTEAANQTQTVVVTFSKPMVPLQALPEGDGTGPLVITPSVRGKFRWLGTTTLAFTPGEPFGIASEYTVRIPAGTKALDGSVLAEEVTWSFTTPRPVLLATRPAHGTKAVDIGSAVALQFNQAMDPDKAVPSIRFFEERRNGPAVRFAVSRATQEELTKLQLYVADSSYALLVKPVSPLKKGKKYIVLLNAGLRGARGSLGMAQEASFSFETYRDFAFAGIDQPVDRDPQLSVTLHFTNPVTISQLAANLSFTPPVEIPAGYKEWSWSQADISIQLPLEANTKYTCTINGTLQDIFGQRLGKDVQFRFNTASFRPDLNMTTGHGILESYGERKYPVYVVNVDTVHVQMLSLSPETVVPWLRSDTIFVRGYPLTAPFQVDKQVGLKAKRDTRSTVGISLADVLGKSQHGAMILQVSRQPGDPFGESGTVQHLRADVQVTAMGLTAKYSPDDILIWVTALRDAQPIANVQVEVRDDSNRVLWRGTTNRDGFAGAPGWGKFGTMPPRSEWSGPRLWVIATTRTDMAYTASTWGQGIEPYRFGIATDWNPQAEPWQGTLFTDRGIYRSGDEVSFKGIFRSRKKGDWAIASGQVIIRISDPQQEQVFADSMNLNEFGSLDASFRLPAQSRLGYYTIDASIRRKNRREPYKSVAGESFRVEAYRVSEFEVTARADRQSYIVGDTVRGSFSARYLFGGEMKHARIRWRLRYVPGSLSPEGWEAYFFGRSMWMYDGTGPQTRLLFSGDTVLNARGKLNVQARTQPGDIRSSGNLILEADVTSPARQTLSGRASMVVHGGEYAIGIRPSSRFITRDSSLSFRVVAVTPEGKPMEGIALRGRVMRREWQSVRKASVQGGYAWDSEAVDTTLMTFTLASADTPAIESFLPPRSGLYVIEVLGKDRRGNEIVSDTYFYASGSDYVAWQRGNDDRIDLIADAATYKPGQTARIIVKNPYEEAMALVSVEREGIMQHWRTTLKGSAPEIAISLNEHSLPNVFVSVVLLQGRMTRKPDLDHLTDVGRPSFKIGYVELAVDPGTRHLKVTARSDRENYRPGDSVTVTFRVNDATGHPARAEVAVSVADKGILNLIGYRLPDPFTSFYGPRPLSVVTTESRSQIVQARTFGEKGEELGGGGGADFGGIETRGNFKSTAFWNAALRTDSAGILTLHFKLPDNLTTFTIMGVAQTTSSEFGYGESSFTVSKPLLLQPSVPRFARLGDAFQAGVVVHNYTQKEGTVRLQSGAEGILFKGKEMMEFSLAAGESREIRQSFKANSVGKARFVFRASMGDETDGLAVSIPVEVPRRKETVADFQTYTANAETKLVIPSNTYAGLGSIDFTASSTALSGLENSIDFLFTYPYGCVEQKCSSILPMILGKEMVEAFGLTVLKGDARNVVQSVLKDLRRYQIWSGGFSYWAGDSRESPYASAYVMYVLVQAKRHGYDVNHQMLDRGVEYIKGVLRWPDALPAYPYAYTTWAGTKTLILYTLALLGKPEPAYYEAFFKNLNRIPLFARAYLLKAVASSTKNTNMIRAIQTDLLNSIKINPMSAHFEEPNVKGLEWCWSSNTRTTGILLQALLESDGFPPGKADLPARIVRWLLDQQRGGRWSNTQENVYVVDALSTYYTTYEKEEPKFRGTIKVAAATVLSHMFDGRTLAAERITKSLDGFEKGKELPVAITKVGTGTLYAGMRMTYYPKDAATPADEGIIVTKTMELAGEANPTSATTYGAGSLVKVTLRIITPQQRSFVVVDDPLPAGMEPVNTSLQTESGELARMLREGQTDEERYRWWGGFNHHELRDDKVLLFADQLEAGVHTFSYFARATTFGIFEMPATYTEMMYEPEVFGQTSGKIIEVK